MSRTYKKKGYQPVGVVVARGAQRAEPEISPETKQSSPQIAPGKSPKPKEKEKQLYHWCHTRALVTELPKDSSPKMIGRQSISLRQQQAHTFEKNVAKTESRY